MRTWIALLLVFTIPVASAGSAPVIGFLSDGESPVDPGAFSLAMPEGNESSARPILMDLTGSNPTVFQGDEALRAGTHLKGPMFAALWIDASAVESGSLQVRILDGDALLVEQAIDVSLDPEALPEPTSLVPADPSDPEGAIFHIAAQVLPAVMHPPILFNLGIVDVEVLDDIRLEISLVPSAEDPLAAGSTLIKYDAKTAPSYVYLPWWSADPAAESPQKQTFTGGSSGADNGAPGGTPVGGPDDGEGGPASAEGSKDKGIPHVGLLPILAVLGAVVWLRRR